ncbi:lutropin-choriogonadotropic hormone receptor-like [Bacillus rossius redtenbacheri]|uniref:lutropin-choriogonadotropic hormone receptor-like n=1 Tax=Bacillus rossius redtenbacheri TaxID=93214 RepID=UPI002FDE0331
MAYISHAPSLRRIGNHVFDLQLPALRSLRIVNTGLENIPLIRKMHASSILHMVDLENNKIKKVPRQSVKVRSEQFLLNYNVIEEVENHAFIDAEIAKLSLKGNRQLRVIQDDAFAGLQSLRDLDLSETAISKLPTNGLRELEILRLQDTDSLKKFPSIYHFEYLQTAYLTYPYHCCAFQFPATHDPDEFAKHEEFVSHIHAKYCAGAGARRGRRSSGSPNETDFGRVVFSPDNRTQWYDGPDWGAISREMFPQGGPDWTGDGVFHQSTAAVSPRLVQAYCGNVSRLPRNVACQPAPDAFSPCEDLMGNWALRAAAWLVAVAALVGNLAVLLVLLGSGSRLSVPKFLMCNLALADLCMGLYLLLIAATDAHSIGEYFNHAIDWQRGVGCQVAGFLTVFSSELSVYTLAVITTERWHAITHAVHVDRRLRLGAAVRVMGAGWLYALAMAALPVLGVSSYSRTSICLPMENRDLADVVYLSSLMAFNGAAFALICGCYCGMYAAIGGASSASARSDTAVAKRMALLVFTDFACWAPVSFFGMTAVAGYPLIDVTRAKILLVSCYPLNSCANPYLYALLTKQYRRDLSALVRRGWWPRRAGKTGNPAQARGNSSTVPPQRAPRSSSSDGCPRGSPHPLRNSNTRLNLNSDHELRLKRALEMSSSDPKPVVLQPLDSHL